MDESVFDSELDIDHFKLILIDRHRHGGGVAVYIHSSLSFEVIKHDISNSLEIIALLILPKFSNPMIYLFGIDRKIAMFNYFNSMQIHYQSLIVLITLLLLSGTQIVIY